MNIDRDLTKKIVGVVAIYGSAIIAGGVIGALVAPDRIDKKIAVAVATLAVGGVIGEHVKKYTDNLIDDLFDLPANIKKSLA